MSLANLKQFTIQKKCVLHVSLNLEQFYN